MKPSGIGGQAVLEGVMMKNKERYAVAVRKPDHDIAIEIKEFHSVREKHKWMGVPFIRGVAAFVESLVLGMKTLTFSAGFYEDEEESQPGKMEEKFNKVFKEKAESILMGITVVFSIGLAIAIFMLLPFFIAGLLEKKIESRLVLTAIEGVIRLGLFIGYVSAISMMKDIRRVFMYHGAEHKSINCIENGHDLTVANVKRQSTQHKRCGTSFMLFVMLLSIIFFMFIQTDSGVLRLLYRILLIPVIAGVSFEFIQLAGRSTNPVLGILSKPGLWLQRLTTREPDEDMIEVAIKSVEAVFDWKPFVEEVRKEKHSRRKNIREESDTDLEQIERTLEQKEAKGADSKKTAADEPKSVKQETAAAEDASVKQDETAQDDTDQDEILVRLDRYLESKGKNQAKRTEARTKGKK